MQRLEEQLQEAQDAAEPLALFVMDLDRFKDVNDTLGHHVGDCLLQEVSRRLVSALRRTDTVARLGGDEFAVLLPGADEERGRSVCNKITAALDQPVRVENLQLRVGISIGVALFPDHAQDGSLLMQRADVAMYEAKRHHRGFSFYAAERDEHSINRLGLATELRDAIDRDVLSLEYQPMVDIGTGQIFCAEALVRWCHPRYGYVPPDEFIGVAEQTGVIRPLTLWVIDQALAQAAAWRRVDIDLRVSVNLSVRSLQDRRLPGQVQKLVDKHQCDPDKVILEITESALMSDPLTARRVMRRLSNMGFQISIDDFGTGYSSLAYLKQLPVDEIKIDRSFITRMDRDENDAVIVRATIDLAHNLGLKVVAEGVENASVWDLLEILGCDTAQGFYIRQPLQAEELASWIGAKAGTGERWGSTASTAG
jgi:diguanylate cyclase (GGDEF)-like protein